MPRNLSHCASKSTDGSPQQARMEKN